MIVPITMPKNGVDQNIGTAAVEPTGNDFSVTFYLNSGYSLSDEAKADLVKQLKKLARQRLSGLSIHE